MRVRERELEKMENVRSSETQAEEEEKEEGGLGRRGCQESNDVNWKNL